jgi:hypothetical protein
MTDKSGHPSPHAGFIAGSGDDGYRRNVRSSIKRIRNKLRGHDPPKRYCECCEGVCAPQGA